MQAREEASNGFIQGLKTFLWVAPLTILIWIYAEREQIITMTVQAGVQVQTINPSERIAIVPKDLSYSLDLQGPRAILDSIRAQLATGQKLDLVVNEDPGFNGEIPIVDRIARNDLLTKNAVKVTSARPPTLSARVEIRRSINVPIQPREPIVGTTTFDPPSVSIFGPDSIINDSRIRDNLKVYADMSRFIGLKPDQYQDTVNLSINPANDNLYLDRKTANVKVEVQTASLEKLRFRVDVCLPSAILDDDKIKIRVRKLLLPNITVTGSPIGIEMLHNGSFPATVTIELPIDEVTKPPINKTLTIRLKPENYHLPPNVTVTNPEQDIVVDISERSN
jgi:hypothetical protein